MKRIFISIIYILFINACAFAQTTLTGKVTDKTTGESLTGVIIYIPDLETGATTNANGEYTIPNLPKGKFLVQVKFIGYAGYIEVIDLTTVSSKDFSIAPSATEMQEVVITGSAFLSDPKRTSVSLAQIDRQSLRTISSTNIISALATVPGVSEISTGAGISKPVIRGLGYNRVIVLSEGIRQEGQQWGDEHGIEIDQFAVDRIEILKGPGSLLYGSDAMGGVINILEPHSPTPGIVQGEISSDYSVNNNLTANSLMLEGNQKGIVWRGRGTYKNAAAFQTPVEYVYNSGFNETNYSGMLGVNKSWGFSHFHLSRYNSYFGMIEGERDSATNKFVNAEGNIVSDAVLKSRKLELPFQNVQHTKLTSVNNFVLGGSQLKLNLGYQANNRKEFEESQREPGLFFHLNTMTYDVKFHLPVKDNIESVIGVSGMTQMNGNRGNEFLVPDYNLQDIGGFVYAKKSYEKLTLNAGLRYDSRNIKGIEKILGSSGAGANGSDTLFEAFNTDFSAFTGATGLTYQINNVFNFKTNIGRGWRAPNIAELGSNGVHEGAFRYEIGNSELKPEISLQIEAELSADGKYLSSSISGFYNHIDNFIYIRNINGENTVDNGNVLAVYRYVQGNSLLQGFEASLDIHPVEQIHFENSISFVQGTNNETKAPLPFIPATRIKHEIKWGIKTTNSKTFIHPYISAGITNYLEQDRFDVFETETKGYTLINAGIGTDIKLRNQILTAFVTANNLTDVKYYEHLSRLKSVSVFNMGRNITFGINVPFGLKKDK